MKPSLSMSIRAKQLLDEGVMNDVFDILREELTGELLRTEASDAQRREELFMTLKGLEKLEMKFAWVCSQQSFEDFQRSNSEAMHRRLD